MRRALATAAIVACAAHAGMCAAASARPAGAPAASTPAAAPLVAAAADVAPVPEGTYVLVNGLLGAGEWDSSRVASLDPETELRFHEDRASLFLAVVFLGPRHTGLDLYLQSRGRTRMLHVSSALGERTLRDGAWSDTVWGRNTWWTANAIGSIMEDGRQRWLEPEAFEFQIDRRELGPDVALFVNLKRPEKRLPAGAVPDASDGWVRLRLE